MIRKLCPLLFLLLGAVYTGFAQVPVAGIKAVPLTGCAPLGVSFSDNSTGGPFTSSTWNFGGGPPNVSPATASGLNTAAQFNTPNTYTVSHTVTNASGSSTATVQITVFPVPTANFTVDKTTGCFPTTINFANTSVYGPGGTLTRFIWDFGDGFVDSVDQNPSHIYHNGGVYRVNLAIQNNFGCSGKAQIKNVDSAITLTNGIFPDFTTSLSTSCTLPVTATFTNSTTGPGNITYEWDFGDGPPWTNNTFSPTHPYIAANIYTVRLAATSDQGCTDTLSENVNISASGNLSDFTGFGNVCINTVVNFHNSSSPPPNSSSWDYGDGTTGNSRDGQHTYTTPGTYHVTLNNNFSGCTGTVTHDVTVVSPPVTAFTATNVNACAPPLTTLFTDQTPGATSWLWNFGDGSPTSIIQNPTHIYNTYGTFQVILTASTAAGCSNILAKNAFVNVVKPKVSITNAPAYGCAPFTYSPSISVVAVDGVASYAWNFGNGFTFNGAVPPPQIYAAGVYTVSLTITTNGGCTATATGVVKVGSLQPVPLFSATPTSQCVGQPVQFTDQTLPGTSNQWFWQFGDGSTDTLENPIYSYTKPGTYDVTLTAYDNGCFQKLTKPAYITINPPLANFGYTFACGAKTNYSFTDSSIGATGWLWDFGDGTPTSTSQNPIHNYLTAVPTTYFVTLTVTNGPCSNSKTEKILVNQSTTINTPKDTICNNVTVTIFTTAPPNIVSYNFDFGDGTTAGSGSGATSHKWTTPGDYPITVTTTDNTGCMETSAPFIMHISGPTVKFTTPNLISCGALAATFTDQTTASPGSTLKAWAWDFGDGGTATGQFPPVHNYIFQGIFPVSLKVTDNNGCADSLTVPNYITVSIPAAKFSPSDTNSCPNKNVKFTNLSTGGFNPTYVWDFKDGTTFSGPNPPLHPFATVDSFLVTLTMTDFYNCTSTYTVPIVIDTPNASFTMSSAFSACPPLNENFTFAGHYALKYLWDLDNGVISTLQNPSSTYFLPRDYYPTLTVTSPGGCNATFTDHIHIDGPIGSFSYSPTAACDSLDVNFQVTSSNSVSYTWNFNDGDTIKTSIPTGTHHYNKAGSFTPFVTLEDAGGCRVNNFGTTLIQIDSIGKTSFTIDKSIICDTGTVHFTNTSILGDSTVITSYTWDFGDGSPIQTGIIPATQHFYSSAGAYTASLNISTTGGCSGSYNVPVTVAASPNVSINGLVSQCEPAVLNFSGIENVPDPNGPLTWAWSFGNGTTGIGQNPGPVNYPKAGEYVLRLIATNTKGCTDTTNTSPAQHLFIYPIPAVNAGPDATICDTSTLQLDASGEATTYVWEPPVNGTLSCLNCINPIASSPVSTYFVLNGSSPQGCQANDTIYVTVNTPITIQVSGTDSVCLGQSSQLSATGAAVYTWTPAEGLNNPNIANPLAKPDASQIGNAPSVVIPYTVTGTDNKNCYTDSKIVNITTFNYPVLTISPNASINVGNSSTINATATTNIVSLNWQPSNTLSCSDCLTPVAKPTRTTTYTLTAVNDGGCASTDSIRIQVVCNGANFFVPNSFSPNGDGVNDNFIINGVGLNVIPSITIYNRWGQIVFQKSNFAPNSASEAWDGTFNGKPAPPDVYIYTLQILCDNATLIPYHGNVTLIR